MIGKFWKTQTSCFPPPFAPHTLTDSSRSLAWSVLAAIDLPESTAPAGREPRVSPKETL
ncbi:hypothetical protein GALL_53550 [mine drainage metagenome]|uniref:Uncharacterized protein n=1 Tax=mine drainage metagenome TaxID=410659 RepID=A0A1J5SY82_9ZZZZ